MSEQVAHVQVKLSGSKEERSTIKQLLANAGIPIETVTESGEETIMRFPSTTFSVSLLLNLLESKPESIQGEIIMPSGSRYEFTEKGLAELRNALLEALKQPQQTHPQGLWWLYFLPELRGLVKEVTNLVRWYPRAVSEGKYTIARNFTLLISTILIGVGILTYVGRVSGDAFVFVIGIVLGYVFSFLHRFLGLSTTRE